MNFDLRYERAPDTIPKLVVDWLFGFKNNIRENI